MIDRIWLVEPFHFGVIRISTATMWMVLVLVILSFGRGSWATRFLLAVTVVGGWLFTFEIPFHWTGTAFGRWDWHTSVLWTLGFGGWIVACWYAGVRPSWRWLMIFAILWIAWIATGFHYNDVGDRRLDWTAEVLNEATKTSLGLAYLFGTFHLLRLPLLGKLMPNST